MKHIKNAAMFCALIFLVGVVMQLGVRAVEWVVPKPETRVVFCFASDVQESKVCRTAAEMLDKGSEVAE